MHYEIKFFIFLIILKAQIKEKLDEYKRQKNELNEYIEMEQFIHEETQKEMRRRMARNDLSSLHERVIFIIYIKILSGTIIITRIDNFQLM